MTRTEELLALAEAATSPYADDWELKQALLKFDRAANPTTIKQLVELVRLQHEALDHEWKDERLAAIEAFNKWEAGK
jgi:hypothetical protein